MVSRTDPWRVGISAAVYVVLYYTAQTLFFFVLGIAGMLAGVTFTVLLAAIFTNWLTLRIYENRSLLDLGLRWSRPSADNLGIGLLGGILCACAVLGPPLVAGAAHFVASSDRLSTGTVSFVLLLLAAGAMGEEILFRGYGFQILLANAGPYSTILPVGAVFALLHAGNPNASLLGILNTAGFGVVFGYAFLRSRDLWLPIGLHFGWNATLPLFGVNLSGLRIGITGHEMVWTAGRLWSGGDYGPEASLLTSAVLLLLFVFLWKAPVRRQHSPLTDP
jgi:membrane protease YdiL (CAAX protease family)